MRDIQGANSIVLINQMVGEAVADGVFDDRPVTELTHMLVAALEEASLMVAHAPTPAAVRGRAAQILDRILIAFATRSDMVSR